jgi:hypothetical protein
LTQSNVTVTRTQAFGGNQLRPHFRGN